MQSLESNEKKTTWKKKRLDDPERSKKKAKKRFIQTENIEPLQNIYDPMFPTESEPTEEVGNVSRGRGPIMQVPPLGFSSSRSKDLSGNSLFDLNSWKCRSKPTPPTPEPEPEPEPSVSEETEDSDAGKEGFSAKKVFTQKTLSRISKHLYKGIFSLNKVIEKTIHQYSFQFVKTFAGKEGSGSSKQQKAEHKADINHDTATVEDIIKYMIACPLAVYVAYNWFFILAYVPAEDYSIDTDNASKAGGKRLADDTNRFNLKEIFNLTNFGDTSFRLIIRFLLGYFIFIFYVTDNLLIGNYTLPYLLSLITGKVFTFIVVIALSFLIIYHCGFYKSLQNAITGKQDVLFFYCLVLICLWFLFRAWSFAKFIIQIIVENKIINIFALILIFFIYCGYLTLIFILGYFSLSISQIIILIYLWINSLFGMMVYNGLYGKKEDGFFSRIDPFSIINKINVFIGKDLERWNDDPIDCHRPDLMKRLIRFIGHFCFTNVFTLCFLFTAMLSSYHASKNLELTSVKNVMYCLLGVLLAVLCLNIWSGAQKVWSNMASQQKPGEHCDGTPLTGAAAPLNMQNPTLNPSDDVRVNERLADLGQSTKQLTVNNNGLSEAVDIGPASLTSSSGSLTPILKEGEEE